MHGLMFWGDVVFRRDQPIGKKPIRIFRRIDMGGGGGGIK
jgi:hypothetical protein